METTTLEPNLPLTELHPRYSLFQHDRERGLWPRPLTIAVAQVRSIPGDMPANVATVVRMLDQARIRDIQIVVFPENFLSGCEPDLIRLDPAAYAVHPKDARLDPILDACRRNEVAAIVGAVKIEESRLYNASLGFNAMGELMAIYHKQHLSEAEQDIYEPGELGRILHWSQWRLGLGVGHDSVTPAHAQQVAEAGGHVYVVSAQFGNEAEGRGARDRLSARARDNGMYVLMANQCAMAGDPDACGRSAIWGPSGAVVAEGPVDGEGLAAVTLDFSTLSPARQRGIPPDEYYVSKRRWPRFDSVSFEPIITGRVFLPLHNAAVPLWEIEASQASRAAAALAEPAISEECEAECRRILDLIIAADIDALERVAAANDQFPNGVDVTWSDQPWIAHAVECAPIEVIAWMIDKGADLSAVDCERSSLLHMALDCEGLEKYAKLEFLLRSGTPTELHGPNDWTAVHLAACRNDVEALRLLRKYGADLRAISFDFWTSTPLESARRLKNWETVAFIEQALLEDAKEK